MKKRFWSLLVLPFFLTVGCSGGNLNTKQDKKVIKENDVTDYDFSEKNFFVDKRWCDLLNVVYANNFDNKEKLKLLTNDQSWVILKIIKHKKYNNEYKRIIENFLKSLTIENLDKSASLNLSYLMHIKSVMIDNEPNNIDYLNFVDESKLNNDKVIKSKLNFDSLFQNVLNRQKEDLVELRNSFYNLNHKNIIFNFSNYRLKFYSDNIFERKYKGFFDSFNNHKIYQMHETRPHPFYNDGLPRDLFPPYASFINKMEAFSPEGFLDDLRIVMKKEEINADDIKAITNKTYEEGVKVSVKDPYLYNDLNSSGSTTTYINFKVKRNLDSNKKYYIQSDETVVNNKYILRTIAINENKKIIPAKEFESYFKGIKEEPNSQKEFSMSLDTSKLFGEDNSQLPIVYFMIPDSVFSKRAIESIQKILNNYVDNVKKLPPTSIISLNDLFPFFKTKEEYERFFK
nr:hypothetical protein [Mycoplasmopsis canis]WQQ12597.1 hypothetical protein RRG48_00935 [Mycoplasmopsis canis]